MPPKKREAKADSKKDATATKKEATSGGAQKKEAVDPQHPRSGDMEVVNGSSGPCSVYLMFSDCNKNNNKFYVAQCLKDKSGNHQLWTRYGRVGENGTPGSIPLAADKAVKEYEKKVKQKTGKGYKPIEVSLGGDKQEAEEDKGDVKYAPSKLKPEVKKLMDFIFDFAMIKKSAQHVGFDTDRMPLGQLSADQVNKGIKCLKAIEELIDSGKGTHA